MAKVFFTTNPNFPKIFKDFLSEKREASVEVDQTVREIISQIRKKGDEALFELSLKFDDFDLCQKGIIIEHSEIDYAVTQCSQETLEALSFAAERIRNHHIKQLPSALNYTDNLGVGISDRWTAVESVGLYVPGGLASYPSSVLMNAIPAVVAGVPRISMVVPSPKGELNPLVLAAAQLSGVTEIYRVGGAQAIAALAYGTKTIKPVVKIVGPGNAYVAAAKRQVFGTVGIDNIAGPSEVLIIADRNNNPQWIAADLLAQAEHDRAAQSILMTDDREFAKAVDDAVTHQLSTLPRGNIAGESWNLFGAIIIMNSFDEAPRLADSIAAEHLQISTEDSEGLAQKIRNAGAIFIGKYTAEVIGDYVAGSNHVLPTARSARFSSGLGVLDFMKRTSLLRVGPEALKKVATPAMTLAKAEGLEAHRRAIELRLDPKS